MKRVERIDFRTDIETKKKLIDLASKSNLNVSQYLRELINHADETPIIFKTTISHQ
jgi:hypothetical protein